MTAAAEMVTTDLVQQVAADDTESPAIELCCTLREADIAEQGAPISVVTVELSDGTNRALAVYAIEPSSVEQMASTASKCESIALSLQSSLSALS